MAHLHDGIRARGQQVEKVPNFTVNYHLVNKSGVFSLNVLIVVWSIGALFDQMISGNMSSLEMDALTHIILLHLYH